MSISSDINILVGHGQGFKVRRTVNMIFYAFLVRILSLLYKKQGICCKEFGDMKIGYGHTKRVT